MPQITNSKFRRATSTEPSVFQKITDAVVNWTMPKVHNGTTKHPPMTKATTTATSTIPFTPQPRVGRGGKSLDKK